MYGIKLQPKAERFLKRLDKKDWSIIIKKLKELQKNSRLGKPLIGKFSGLWSLRIGKYRALYQIKESELIIFVLNIGHRKNVYG